MAFKFKVKDEPATIGEQIQTLIITDDLKLVQLKAPATHMIHKGSFYRALNAKVLEDGDLILADENTKVSTVNLLNFLHLLEIPI